MDALTHAAKAAREAALALTIAPPTNEQLSQLRKHLGQEPATTTERNAA